jgi:hypothetical protein
MNATLQQIYTDHHRLEMILFLRGRRARVGAQQFIGWAVLRIGEHKNIFEPLRRWKVFSRDNVATFRFGSILKKASWKSFLDLW